MLMGTIISQPQWQNEGYREEWATPYMAAIARLVFRGKPEVTLTPQPGPGEGLAPFIHPRLGLPEPDVTLTPQPGSGVLPRYIPLPLDSPDVTLTPQRMDPFVGIIGKLFGKPDVTLTPQPVEERITALGTEGEWLKKNRILLIVVIVALVLLFFFLKKRRR